MKVDDVTRSKALKPLTPGAPSFRSITGSELAFGKRWHAGAVPHPCRPVQTLL